MDELATPKVNGPLLNNIPMGLRKAAILIMSLDDDDAALILSKLSRHDVERISVAIAQMDMVSGQEQEQVIREFLQGKASAIGPNAGGFDRAKSLLEKALGDEANEALAVLQQSLESVPFGFLHKTDPQNILSFLIDEHPQTIAIVLSHLPPSLAAGVLNGLPPEHRLSVVERIAEMGETSPDAIEEVEKALSARMSVLLSQGFRKAGGVPAVAEILNVCDRSTERAILDALAQEKPELVEEIRRLMFVFEDIAKLSDKDIQTVLKHVETSQWALALKGASEQLQQKILSNMSQRAADMLREEMDFLGKVRLSEVEAVQQKIVDVVRSLEDAGQISRPSGDKEEEYVA